MKKNAVPSEFDHVASRYDLMCKLNPGYRKHLRRSAEHIPNDRHIRVLDLCCGTGLSTDAIVRSHPDAEVIGLDASQGMLLHAKSKQWPGTVSFVLGDAGHPQGAGLESKVDAVFMAYGIRNLPDPDSGLASIRSIIKPGGRLVLHEYTLDGHRRSRWIWNAVTIGIVIPLGRVLTGRADLFRYLRKSVFQFDTVDRLIERLVAAGFQEVRAHRMPGWQAGILHTIVARNPGTSNPRPAP